MTTDPSPASAAEIAAEFVSEEPEPGQGWLLLIEWSRMRIIGVRPGWGYIIYVCLLPCLPIRVCWDHGRQAARGTEAGDATVE